MKINRINIKNYKSMVESGNIFVDEQIMALIGQNNTGKSTVLDAIQCVFPEAKKNVEYKDFHNRSKNVEIELEFSLVTEEYLKERLYSEDLRKKENSLNEACEKGASPDEIAELLKKYEDRMASKIKEAQKKYEIDNEVFVVKQIVPPGGKKKSELKSGAMISDADLKKILPVLKVIPAIRNPQNESTAGTNSYMKELIQMLDDNIETTIEVGQRKINYNELNQIIADESNRRCSELSKKITEKYTEAVGSTDFEIHISSEVNIAKGTAYSTKLVDTHAELESDMLSCGTGYQSMIILSILQTFLELDTRQVGYILIIEEPEVYLHPNLQRKMIETLCKLSLDNQVIFSTHSPITISALTKSQILLIVKENARAHVEPINVKKVIEELGVRPADILMQNGVILVEGPDDKKAIEILLNKIDKRLTEKINIVSTGSCSKIAFFASVEKVLYSLPKVPVLIIRDADYLMPEEQKLQTIKEIKKFMENSLEIDDKELEEDIFVIGEHALESLFMDPNIISNVLQLNFEVCQDACLTYQKGYENAMKKQMGKDVIAKYFQPKYFWEKNLDKYGWSDAKSVAREKWDEAYYENWERVIKDMFPENREEKITNFRMVREGINKYTCDAVREQRNYIVEILESMSLKILEKNSFSKLVKKLKDFSTFVIG